MARTKKEPTPPYLWVVEVYSLFQYPHIIRYDLREIRKTGYKVNQRGFDKFIRQAAGRSFYTDEQKLWEFLRLWVQEKVDAAHRAVAEYTATLKRLVAGDKTAMTIDTMPNAQHKFKTLILK